MGELADVRRNLDRYKVNLTRQQEADLANKEYLQTLVDQLRSELQGSQRALVDEIMRNLPESIDLTPVTNALDALSRTSGAILEAVGDIRIPKTDLSSIEYKLEQMTQEKGKGEWDFAVKYDRAGRPSTIKAKPSG